ncbi:transpeptidase family protein [Flavobacterium agricola]|uniref:Transpeptidase family protein n=1 Tax=Flavobacterium agricola TaxID=2870839 RepID=A0ABY6LYP0_9FLAO|nr:penicillin-binding protein [Flavobacterium agricola]UYW00657.1 transpeptidase family protein [Flavobacterium agricola]
MGVNKKSSFSTGRLVLVVAFILIIALGVLYRLFLIVGPEGEDYREIARSRTIREIEVPANRGNVYSADGSLLATSVPKYTISFDAVAPSTENFTKYSAGLADSLSVMLGGHRLDWLEKLRKARSAGKRYYFITRNLSFTDYSRIKKFPLFNLGANKGGIIVETKTIREHPMGKIAERTIGDYRTNADGTINPIGIEGSFNKELSGENGFQLMQKFARSQWKPISDFNYKEPVDGYDIVSTIDVYIQDIAHHALLKQLVKYDADHGSVVVMETKTGEVKAIANLGRGSLGQYYERMNYAVGEIQDPGSTFKLFSMMALLDDKKVDTAQVFDSFDGTYKIHGYSVRDSNRRGYGKISLGKGFEKSSNTVIVQAVYDAYKDNPSQFVNRMNDMGLNKPLGIPIVGEGKPLIPQPTDKTWSSISLPWMAYGYGINLTPLQMLTFYNAVANDGEMIKPLFVKEIKKWNKSIKKFDKEIIHPKVCSDETLAQLKDLLKRAVEHGTGKSLYSPNFSMAGKTGTAQVDYHKGDNQMYYASSFAGFFPAENPKYSCVVVIHKPNPKRGYYGGDVAGPVFKRIAQKIFTDVPSTNEIVKINEVVDKQKLEYDKYTQLQANAKTVPNLKGVAGMDAIAILENLGFKVKLSGNPTGKVKKQSLAPGSKIVPNTTIILEFA